MTENTQPDDQDVEGHRRKITEDDGDVEGHRRKITEDDGDVEGHRRATLADDDDDVDDVEGHVQPPRDLNIDR